jgi:RNA polymerase subunit RPABC4/transcription elongation factor Spt4
MNARRVCPTCKYDLRGLPSPRCPECGRRFSTEEWADSTLLTPMPAWERLDRVNVLYALPATILAMLVRPRRFLRLLRVDEGVLRTVVFFVLLIPTAWVIAAVISVAAARGGYYFKDFFNYASWKGYLWGFDGKWGRVATDGLRVAIHCTAFLCATLALWLPALVVLDLVFWRDRLAFRLFAKAVLYCMVWACVVAALAATLGRAVMGQFDPEWTWNPVLRYSLSEGIMPWICWVALAVVTAQCVMLLWFVQSPRCAFRPAGHRAARLTCIVIGITWMLAAYLLLLDRHVHLRFHLQFVGEELWSWYGRYFRGL